MIKINKSIEYTTETQKMSLNIPDDILNIIGEYASLSIETKKYKRISNSNKMKITKIKYICHSCKKNFNKNNLTSRFTCNRCDPHFTYRSGYALSFAYCDLFGYYWKKYLLFDEVMDEFLLLHSIPKYGATGYPLSHTARIILNK